MWPHYILLKFESNEIGGRRLVGGLSVPAQISALRSLRSVNMLRMYMDTRTNKYTLLIRVLSVRI